MDRQWLKNIPKVRMSRKKMLRSDKNRIGKGGGGNVQYWRRFISNCICGS